MIFTLEKVSNMIFLTGDQDIVFKAWDESEFTERKLSNAIKKLQSCYVDKIQVIRKF
ncbi:MAG: hypothetical protein IJ516_05545 [Phascolarctobacterium sp.]|nr:hypothetical protein [Phascolarctobacterium sp.]